MVFMAFMEVLCKAPLTRSVCYDGVAHRCFTFTFTFMHLADAFIQSDLQCIQAIHVFLLLCVFPGNRTHNLLCC